MMFEGQLYIDRAQKNKKLYFIHLLELLAFMEKSASQIELFSICYFYFLNVHSFLSFKLLDFKS